MNPLFNGTGTTTLFRARLDIPPLPPGECLRDSESLRQWLAESAISIVSRNLALFAYTAGPASAATPDDRDKPRILFDEGGRYLGPALWMPDVQGWSLAGVPGELKTVVRSKGTVAEDMEAKALNGWFLADGSNPALPDLKPAPDDANGFFVGTAPDFEVYTVGKVA